MYHIKNLNVTPFCYVFNKCLIFYVKMFLFVSFTKYNKYMDGWIKSRFNIKSNMYKNLQQNITKVIVLQLKSNWRQMRQKRAMLNWKSCTHLLNNSTPPSNHHFRKHPSYKRLSPPYRILRHIVVLLVAIVHPLRKSHTFCYNSFVSVVSIATVLMWRVTRKLS